MSVPAFRRMSVITLVPFRTRMTNFGKITHGERVVFLQGQSHPIQGSGPQPPKLFGTFILYVLYVRFHTKPLAAPAALVASPAADHIQVGSSDIQSSEHVYTGLSTPPNRRTCLQPNFTFSHHSAAGQTVHANRLKRAFRFSAPTACHKQFSSVILCLFLNLDLKLFCSIRLSLNTYFHRLSLNRPAASASSYDRIYGAIETGNSIIIIIIKDNRTNFVIIAYDHSV